MYHTLKYLNTHGDITQFVNALQLYANESMSRWDYSFDDFVFVNTRLYVRELILLFNATETIFVLYLIITIIKSDVKYEPFIF